MKMLDFYKKELNCKDANEVFDCFTKNLKPSDRLWSYFVNWEKVFSNTKKIEVALNSLNYLIGKKDFEKEFRFLIKENPALIEVIPALVVRDGKNAKKFNILVDYQKKKLVYEDFDFDKNKTTDKDINAYLLFMEKTGIKHLITSQKIKNLVDYMIGVEAGLDSNGRKNRGGKSMEDIVEHFIKDICLNKKLRYLKEANADKIKSEFGCNVPVDKSSRRYDFVINKGKEIIIVETNFYSGGGSKLKSTAGEYRNLFDVLDGKFRFVWITDGDGWKSTHRPLRETFDHNDYVVNLKMVEQGILGSILN
ncbi:MAG: hypothetical protein A2452_07430 [Candidatus Firestonebacteria bacterium RIFOXYC2_FULL_39_67]|nr:MAG: hypothetical protein A2452_07430 [Candidatus Firestonebacteria bacterium RIFOXYC2_FULL_39_67]